MRCAVLTYHSQIFTGAGYGGNDHVRLVQDLARIHRAGHRIVPLHSVVDRLLGRGRTGAVDRAGPDRIPGPGRDGASDRAVCITFDDGALLDFTDVEHPRWGRQRGFLNILRDFRREHGADAQPALHATTFVIANPDARRSMDRRSLYGLGWMDDEWWREAEADPCLSVESHGWDHHHPDVDPADPRRGRFDNVDDEAGCRLQVTEAGRAIEQITGRRPSLFAYPFGQASDFLRREFLPGRADEHGLDAAVSTDPGYVTTDSERWWLPRFVAGRDWKTPEELDRLLAGLE